MIVAPVVSRFGLFALMAFVAASFPLGLAVAAPPALDEERLSHITAVFEAFESKEEWAKLARDGEKVFPYVARLLAAPPNDRVAFRALIFARTDLSKFDRKSLVEPTLEYLKHQDWELRAEAMMLLEEIGSGDDCPAVAVLLHSESERHRSRIRAVLLLVKLGGPRELFVLDQWSGWESMEKDYIDAGKKARDELRARLEKEAKGKPVEATEADKAVAKFADADAKVRVAAVETLKKVGSRADSTAVVALLHDPDATVREAAADWLGAVGGKRELIALEIRLREPKATDDAAFDAVAKAKKAVAERVEADEKKLKAKSPDAKPEKK